MLAIFCVEIQKSSLDLDGNADPVDQVQGRSCLTDFHGMSLTRDKICSLIKK